MMLTTAVSTVGLNHLGVAVASIAEARTFYEHALGAVFEGEEVVEEQRVRTAFLRIGDGPSAVRIELLEATSADSPIAKFLEKRGPGLHHVAYTVDDVRRALAAAEHAGVRLIDSAPRRGAHGAEIAFLHPQSTGGILTELCRPAPLNETEPGSSLHS
jgi:methylmalonyl-CoA/ethylmalonyl-CoA epimerase